MENQVNANTACITLVVKIIFKKRNVINNDHDLKQFQVNRWAIKFHKIRKYKQQMPKDILHKDFSCFRKQKLNFKNVSL